MNCPLMQGHGVAKSIAKIVCVCHVIRNSSHFALGVASVGVLGSVGLMLILKVMCGVT